MKPLALLALLASVLFLGTGCGTVTAFKQPFVAHTNTVPVVITIPGQTNTVARIVEATTNVVGNVVTITPPFVTNIVTITPPAFVTNWSTNVTFEVNPGVQSALATLETVNKFNPTPSAPIIDAFLYLALGALGCIAKVKTRKAEENASLARTLVIGIEESQSADTKAAVARAATAAGNAPQVNALVQRITRAF
jgi:hypothetical protein